MPRKKMTPAVAIGTAEVENDAAERDLEAAKKRLEAARIRSQARVIAGEEEDTDSQPQPQHEPFQPEDLPPHMRPAFYDDSGQPTTEPAAEPAAPVTKMDRILKELSGDGKFVVHKMVAGSPMKVGVYDINDWPDMMDSVAREHGGGTFRIRFMNHKGEWVGQETQNFDPKAYGKETPAASTSDMLIARMMEQMSAREERLQTQLQNMQTQQNAMMLEIIKASGSHQSRTAEEVVSLMKATRDLSGDREKDSPLESVKGILEVVAMLNNHGVGEPPNPVNVAIDKAFQLAGPLLGAWAAKLGSAAAGGPTPTAMTSAPQSPQLALPNPRQPEVVSAPSLPSNAPPALPNPPPQRPNPALKTYATSLLAAASAGQSPESVAEAIISMVAEEEIDNLFELVSDPGFVGQMLATEPQLAPHQAWLVGLCNSIKEALTSSEPEVDSPPPSAPSVPAGGPAQ